MDINTKIALAQLSSEAQAALKLLDSETADALIGEEPEEHRALILGAQAIIAMAWSIYKANGLRQTKETLKQGAQELAMICTLIHYAYALGIRRGQQKEEEDGQDR